MTNNETPRKLRTVERALTIAETVMELDGAGVTQIADHMNLSPSTVHGYLVTLREKGYLIQQEDEYSIGAKFLHLGGCVTKRNTGYEFVEMKVEELAQDTGERSQFIIDESGLGYYIFTSSEDPAVQIDARIGKIRYLHASAAGKAILSTYSDDKIDSIIERWGLKPLTENTITTRDELFEELRETAERDYSLNREETVKGLRAVGAPIMAPDGKCFGALSVSAPANRFKGEQFVDEVPMRLLGATNDVELQLAHQ